MHLQGNTFLLFKTPVKNLALLLKFFTFKPPWVEIQPELPRKFWATLNYQTTLCLKEKTFFLSKWKDNHWSMWFSQTLECKSLWLGYFPFLLSKNWSAVSSNFTTLWIVPEGYTFYSRNTWLPMFFDALLAENRNNLDAHQLMIG